MPNGSLSRKEFLTGVSALTAIYPASFLKLLKRESMRGKEPDLILPPALKPGDTIGIVAPASDVYEHEEINMGRELIESLGFRTVLGKHVSDRYGYLAGHDADRAQDLNDMFRRDDVQGIICIRGGYGSMRILPLLDYKMIRSHPKVLMGYSDITSLLLSIYRHSRLVTFHGPVVLSTYSPYTREYLKKALMNSGAIGLVEQPPLPVGETVEQENRIVKIGKGRASGELVGGNLTLLVSSLGTPFEPDLRGKILFFEEIGEEPYRIDRMLTQLWLTGRLQKLKGIVVGKMTDCTPSDYKPAFYSTLSVEQILRNRIEPLGIPALYGLMIGHIKDKITVPVGVRATIDAGNGTFSIDQPAVRS